MEGNEMNVFVQTHGLESEKEDGIGDSILRHNKSGFRHFVEESTLRNVNLDELEELSDSGCPIDGNIRRASSTVSSEPPVRFAIIFEWHSHYYNSAEGILRLALLMFSTVSLGFVTGAGNSNADVLDMSFASYVRAHIFVTVFAILIALTFFALKVTSVIESLPLYWNAIDAVIHGSLCALLLFSSLMLFHAERLLHFHDADVTRWTCLKMSFSAGCGFICALLCVFITILRSCAKKTPVITEDIVLTTIMSS